MKEQLEQIAQCFALEGCIASIDSLGEGFINDTYVIHTKGAAPNYILQRKNKTVFVDVPGMMENIHKVTEHIRRKVEVAGGNPDREVLHVIPTKEGALYTTDSNGEYWAVSRYIDDAVTYDKADTPALARMGGEGIGLFQSQLVDFDKPLTETIPGFHNIRHRFEQWNIALVKNAAGRCADLQTEIGWIEARRERMLAFRILAEEGTLPARVTHNDTKISNILFDAQGAVLCVIDLDTVMRSTSLNDFGDAIRSYTNTGTEDDRDLSQVGMSMELFTAYTEGYLSKRGKELTQPELDHLAFSALYITYEQILRFLMDYIDGDHYYKIKYDTHNLIRTHAQYRLLESMEEQYEAMCEVVRNLTKKYR